MITRPQLVELGFGEEAIKHRISKGRLHPVAVGVYAVGRPLLTQHGRWMAAVLSCGRGAVLSHYSAAALWRILVLATSAIHVSVRASARRERPGVVVHRRGSRASDETTERHGIPVTSPACTLIDLAACLSPSQVEAAINEADKRDLVSPSGFEKRSTKCRAGPGSGLCARSSTAAHSSSPTLSWSGVSCRWYGRQGFPRPRTGRYVNRFKVDFFWPELRLVVETDGLRYHRTPGQQARDRLRDQAHTAAGLTSIRFTHAQARDEPGHICAILRRVAQRLREGR